MKTGKILFFVSVLSMLPLTGQQVPFRTTGEAVRYYEELVGTLTQQVRAMQDENAKLAGTVYELQRRVKALEQNYQGIRSDIQNVKQTFETDKGDRARQFNQLADKLQKAASAPQQPSAQAAASAAKGSGGEQQTEEYDLYEVQQGDTLYVISRATGVSVSDIRRANNLKKDTIRVGQKLKILRRKTK